MNFRLIGFFGSIGWLSGCLIIFANIYLEIIFFILDIYCAEMIFKCVKRDWEKIKKHILFPYLKNFLEFQAYTEFVASRYSLSDYLSSYQKTRAFG